MSSLWLLDSLFFISFGLSLTLLFLVLSNNSFPSSLNFISEIIAVISVIGIDVLLSLFFLLLSFLSTLFWFIVLNSNLPYHSSYYMSSSVSIVQLVLLILLNYLPGIYLLLLLVIIQGEIIFMYLLLVFM